MLRLEKFQAFPYIVRLCYLCFIFCSNSVQHIDRQTWKQIRNQREILLDIYFITGCNKRGNTIWIGHRFGSEYRKKYTSLTKKNYVETHLKIHLIHFSFLF